MKKVLFINAYIYLPGEKAIKRTFFLFEMMRKQNYDVHFLTSDFNHYEKKQRSISTFFENYPEYKDYISFVHMRPYKKNISVSRYLSNLVCDIRSIEWFKKNGRNYDVVYISWPASYLTRKIKKLCVKYDVKMILDINDLWPDSLRLIIKNEVLYNCLTYKMRKNTQKAYACADSLVAVSQEYLDKALEYNNNSKENLPIYIGAMIEKFDKGVEKNIIQIRKPEGEIWITYIGTIGRSYDFETVMYAVAALREETGLNIRFKILGKGPEEKRLDELNKKIRNSATDFVGFLDYEMMAAFLTKSDICVNCIKKRASQSIINKVSDYFAAGKPVINCGPCKEMKMLISQYRCGINYEAESVKSCKDAILKIIEKPDKAKEYGVNARHLAEEKFDRVKTHQEIIEMINRL